MSEPLSIGLDPSLRSFAVCGLDGGAEQMKLLSGGECGPTECERLKRYQHLVADVYRTIQDMGTPAIVLIESYSFGSPFKSVVLGELGSLLRQAIIMRFGVVVPVAPTTLKKFATGKGRGKKLVVAVATAKRWDVEFETDDEYDAYVLARIGRAVLGLDTSLIKPQREVAKMIHEKWQAELEARRA